MPNESTTINADPSVEKILSSQNTEDKELSIEALVLLLQTASLQDLTEKSDKECQELKVRQTQVSNLQKLLKRINAATNAKGEFECADNKETQELLALARTIGVDELDPQKTQYTKEEKDRLVENIRMTIQDLNIQNDMQLQKANQIYNEINRIYQFCMKVMNPYRDAIKQTARGIHK